MTFRDKQNKLSHYMSKLKNTLILSLFLAALTEPISCLAHGYDIVQPLTVGKKILITGAGIIGNLWISTLHHQGHRNVTVSEPNASRLKLVEKLGELTQT